MTSILTDFCYVYIVQSVFLSRRGTTILTDIQQFLSRIMVLSQIGKLWMKGGEAKKKLLCAAWCTGVIKPTRADSTKFQIKQFGSFDSL
ncbi:hypothetical protein ACS49_02440 [Bacillus cereus]|nr:hypothetical protein ACS49_02440 [Bacillus cereus]